MIPIGHKVREVGHGGRSRKIRVDQQRIKAGGCHRSLGAGNTHLEYLWRDFVVRPGEETAAHFLILLPAGDHQIARRCAVGFATILGHQCGVAQHHIPGVWMIGVGVDDDIGTFIEHGVDIFQDMWF